MFLDLFNPFQKIKRVLHTTSYTSATFLNSFGHITTKTTHQQQNHDFSTPYLSNTHVVLFKKKHASNNIKYELEVILNFQNFALISINKVLHIENITLK